MIDFESTMREMIFTPEQIRADLEYAIETLKQRLGRQWKANYPSLDEEVLEIIAERHGLDMSAIFNTSGNEEVEIERQKLGKLMDTYTTGIIDEAIQKHFETI